MLRDDISVDEPPPPAVNVASDADMDPHSAIYISVEPVILPVK